MATKKTIWILFSLLVISTWVLGSVILSGAETMKCKTFVTTTKYEKISASDEENHILALQIAEGLAYFENGLLFMSSSCGSRIADGSDPR